MVYVPHDTSRGPSLSDEEMTVEAHLFGTNESDGLMTSMTVVWYKVQGLRVEYTN